MQRRSFSIFPALAAAHALFRKASSSRFCCAGVAALQQSQFSGCPSSAGCLLTVEMRGIDCTFFEPRCCVYLLGLRSPTDLNLLKWSFTHR